MSSSSEPQPPVEPAGPRKSSTQEIPVVQPTAGATAVQSLPPHPGATAHAPVQVSPEAADGPQPTGPVDFVPGLPGLGTPPPPPPVRPQPHAAAAAPTATLPPASAVWPDTLEADEPVLDRPAKAKREKAPREKGPRTPQDRAALIGLGLVVLSLALLELGLTVSFDAPSYWSLLPLWSGFATVCVLLCLLVFAAFYRGGNRERSGPAWRVAAGGLVGLAVFWLLVVLPVVASDRGFVLTAALAALGAALWIGPRRKA